MKAVDADDLRMSVSKIKALPTIPLVLTKILDLVEDQNSTIQDLERAIQSDQSITAKVLRLANSAFYGFPRKITTISKAIILIGFNSVKNIAIGVLVFEAFQCRKGKGAEEIEAGWVHAVEVAFGAKMLATKLRYAKAEEAFVGGLLHDIGKVVFVYSDYEQYLPVLEKAAAEAEWESHLAAERDLLGSTHTEIGEILGVHWQLPGPIVACIRLHHTPDPVTHHPQLVRIVSLSNRLAHDKSIPAGEVASQGYYSALSLSEEEVERFRENMKRYAHETEAFFNVA